MVRCAGEGGRLLWLSGLSEVSLDGFLLVDPVSLAALQIFTEEAHPSAMGIGAHPQP